MSRDCALKPNVHLAHHPNLDMDCLYDHVHLHRETVPIFPCTMKDVTLNRGPITSHRSSTAPTPPGPARRPLDLDPEDPHQDWSPSQLIVQLIEHPRPSGAVTDPVLQTPPNQA
ncbi:hypothetical protein AAFF_G00046090 [Aldrovandia affinis]|uniref:Uncharacterized protein n=1 Tax=Aldrovandia affinis TaxID=143900 RepID=A0AAD7S1Z6_9TELE|nr:hypothetical protein AAFF_G00046090 [Aldrovandia affinis]